MDYAFDLKPKKDVFIFINNICCSFLKSEIMPEKASILNSSVTGLLYCVPLITGWPPENSPPGGLE